MNRTVVALTCTMSLSGCDVLSVCDSARPGASPSCPVPGWLDRSFDLEVPASWNGTSPLPVVFAFHGGGGNKLAALTTACPDGNAGDPGCFDEVARARGIAVVRPDGTGGRPASNVRTWNSGGGADGLNCASGAACAEGVYDIAYFDALYTEVSRILPIDPKRVFLAGLSNGGSITYRIACERADRVAAAIGVGTGNQFAARSRGGEIAVDPAACKAPVAVLDIHGTEDPCWTYDGSAATCLAEDGTKIGTAATLEGWRVINGCSADAPREEALPDNAPNDGTRASRRTWSGCRAALQHIRVEGGGHTWPNGNPYLSRVGRVTRDFGSELLVDFLVEHGKP